MSAATIRGMADAPNKSKRWTDTEDSVVDLFPAAQAAELLGRTYQAVRSRRDQLGLDPYHGNRKGKKRLRREYFQTGEGPREEAVPPLKRPKCRLCRRKVRAKGLCMKCYKRLHYHKQKATAGRGSLRLRTNDDFP
jgi:SLT domain-containing protein